MGKVVVEKTAKEKHGYINKKTTVALGLLAVAGAATLGSKLGVTEDPELFKQVANSLRHPLLGYIGSWAADKLPSNSGGVKIAQRIVGATAANFAGEAAQTLLVTNDLAPWSSQNPNFTSEENGKETIKDWGFSIAGSFSYMLAARNQNRIAGK